MPQVRAASFATRRRSFAQPLADLVAPCIGPALARQGFGNADVLLQWPAIVGDELAEHCRPVKLQWRRRASGADPEERLEPATLVVRVEGSYALVLQHMAPVILERINAYFGWRCAGRMVLKQGPLPAVPEPRSRVVVVDDASRVQAVAVAGGIEDDRLRAALVGLGSRVFARSR